MFFLINSPKKYMANPMIPHGFQSGAFRKNGTPPNHPNFRLGFSTNHPAIGVVVPMAPSDLTHPQVPSVPSVPRRGQRHLGGPGTLQVP